MSGQVRILTNSKIFLKHREFFLFRKLVRQSVLSTTLNTKLLLKKRKNQKVEEIVPIKFKK